jgi:lysophospholipase L1-like esterase
MDEPTAIIVGHSFVKRYATWIGSHDKMAPPSPSHVCNRVTDLQFLGVSGLKSNQLHEDDYIFQASRHDIVIVDCGSNDLARGESPISVANNVLLFSRRCIENGAKMAVITSILPRTQNIRCSPEDFRQMTKQYNSHMMTICRDELKINFHTHKGFVQQVDAVTHQPVVMWSTDGIHPSPIRQHQHLKSGMEKYNDSMKTALHRAVHKLRYLHAGFGNSMIFTATL